MFTRDYIEFFDLQSADADTRDAVRRDFTGAIASQLGPQGVAPAPAERIASRLWTAMTQPLRHYHSPVHVLSMFEYARRVGLALTPADELAIWFHDSVYDPAGRNGTNESASADLMRQELEEWVDPAVLGVAAGAILSTAMHTRDDVEPEHHRVMDLDLASFAAPPPVFSRQSAALRLEFPYLSDTQYAASAVEFLRSLLARRRVFRTPTFAPWEPVAREQIRGEIERLSRAYNPPLGRAT